MTRNWRKKLKTWKKILWGPVILILGATTIMILFDAPVFIILFMEVLFLSTIILTLKECCVKRTTVDETNQLPTNQKKIENLKDELDQAEALLAATKEVNKISKKYNGVEIELGELKLNAQRIKSAIKKLEALVAHSAKPQEPEMVIVSMLPAYRVEKETDYHDLS
jgi:septal ring factor EnvC (AmiA/AmiB activator)